MFCPSITYIILEALGLSFLTVCRLGASGPKTWTKKRFNREKPIFGISQKWIQLLQNYRTRRLFWVKNKAQTLPNKMQKTVCQELVKVKSYEQITKTRTFWLSVFLHNLRNGIRLLYDIAHPQAIYHFWAENWALQRYAKKLMWTIIKCVF